MAEPADLTPEQREFNLVSSVEFRILNVANDERKLHQVLGRYLVPLLLKLGSPNPALVEKVHLICIQLMTFIKPPEVVLPVAALLDQFKSTKSAGIRDLSFQFILHSLPRIDSASRRALLPRLFPNISAQGWDDFGSADFFLVLAMLPDLTSPAYLSTVGTSFRTAVGLSSAADAQFVALWLGRTILARMPQTDQTLSTEVLERINPELTREQIHFLRFHTPDGARIFSRGAELRALAARFLASAAFTGEERLLPSVYAAGCADTRVSSIGEDMLKRSAVSLEEETLVRSLFEAHSRLRAKYRIRILGLLSKSVKATTMGTEIVQVVETDSFTDFEHSARQFLQPTSGREELKLHNALFRFLAWMAQSSAMAEVMSGKVADGPTVGEKIVHLMRKFIHMQGWPVPSSTTADDMIKLRSSAYELIGALLTRGSMLISRKELWPYIPWFFESLMRDPSPQVVISIDGALSSLAGSFPKPNEELTAVLVPVLLNYMRTSGEKNQGVRSVRHAVINWANRCLPYANVHARWLDVLGAAAWTDEPSDVAEEAQKGLDPWFHVAHVEKGGKLTYPAWHQLVDNLFGRKMAIMPPAESQARDGNQPMVIDSQMGTGTGHADKQTDTKVDWEKVTDVFLNFPNEMIRAFPLALSYCRKMLFLAAVPGLEIGPDWESVLDGRVRNDSKTRTAIREYIATQDEASVAALLRVCLEGAVKNVRVIVEDSLGCFVQLAVFCPKGLLGRVTRLGENLLPHVLSVSEDALSRAVQAYGMLAAHPDMDEVAIRSSFDALVDAVKPFETAVGTRLSKVEGGLVGLAHLCSRLVYYGREMPGGGEEVKFETMLAEGRMTSLRRALLQSCGQLWTAGLRQEPRDPDLQAKLVQSLVKDAKAGNETAIWALGRLAVASGDDGVDDDDHAGSSIDSGPIGAILTELFKLHELRQLEVHFAVGEAIAAATARWDSASVQLTLDVDTTATGFRKGRRGALLTAVLDKLFADCKATKPSLLKASGVWLFSIVQYCSRLEEVQGRLRDIQAAFMRLLSARDELVQETASRGLELVYERGDESLRGGLVRDLVAAFTGTGTVGSQLKVDEETELFEPGALATGDGKSVTSYRDIVNLAQEVGDQSLVYRFMSLANNAATWSTRSAFGRFGLSTILSDGAEVDARLWPKLFRYRFDPNPNVRRSMNDIWRALARDEKAVLAEHFGAIMEDLLKNMLTKEWRVREASCAAVADLVAGQPFERYGGYYAEMWANAARVLDDIKGSVREAALRLSLGLANTLARQLEESGTSLATKAMMAEALPFLMSAKGVESGVQDVQLFSITTVLKLVKAGGATMKPYIPALLPQLLGLLSTIEPDQIGYGYQRLREDQREVLDRMRSSMVRQSPLSDAIDELLRHVDVDVFAELAPLLRETVKKALALPTKVAAGRVIATLFMRHATTAAPEAPALLDMLKSHVFERNDEASKGYAHAAAYVMRAASPADQAAYVRAVEEAYFAAEDGPVRRKAADAVVAVSKISPDVFSAHEAALLPLSFVAARDLDGYARKGFGEVWDAHAGTARTTARYVLEIATLAGRALDAARWDLRHAGALAAAGLAEDAVRAAAETTGSVSPGYAKSIWPLLEKSLALKTFAGKERVVAAFPKFVEKAPVVWKTEEGEEGGEKKAAVASQMTLIALREAKRNNDDYRPHALAALTAYARVRPDLDLVDDVAAIATPLLISLADEDDDEMPDADATGGHGKAAADPVRARARAERQARIADAGVKAVMGSWTETMMAADPAGTLARLEKAVSWPDLVDMKVGRWGLGAYLDEVKRAMDAAAEAGEKKAAAARGGGGAGEDDGSEGADAADSSVAVRWFRTIGIADAKKGYEAQRLARARTAAAVARAWRAGVWGADGGGRTRDHLRELALRDGVEGERSQDVAEAWRSVAEGLKGNRGEEL